MSRLPPRHGLARLLSKRGLCSRSEAERLIRAGKVRIGGRLIVDPEYPCTAQTQDITIDGAASTAAEPRRVIALNKPRGLVTTTQDERGRETVYSCLKNAGDAWLAPVGRLDKASEGLLLFTNDPAWAALITDPATGPVKTYHVQVDGKPGTTALAAMCAGVMVPEVGTLRAASARVLREGTRNAWLEVVLEEGRNRQIRRLMQAFDLEVMRLVRVAIGPLLLGELPKGEWRELHAEEIAALTPNLPTSRAAR